jgi:hypothetical protein
MVAAAGRPTLADYERVPASGTNTLVWLVAWIQAPRLKSRTSTLYRLGLPILRFHDNLEKYTVDCAARMYSSQIMGQSKPLGYLDHLVTAPETSGAGGDWEGLFCWVAARSPDPGKIEHWEDLSSNLDEIHLSERYHCEI